MLPFPHEMSNIYAVSKTVTCKEMTYSILSIHVRHLATGSKTKYINIADENHTSIENTIKCNIFH